ncbi:type II toxin-antitoxin system death-on-curing family toxin [Propionivibrio sp.]|uniref:type II toxin-antitoxin system death-on-curing family toxin n=1 Tax=Propionivibrio sp. TaxID=2212460 RepID=UPI0025D0CE27|nr:type II toxin-antitoxin system death-on-curing family toxin [Propionivibrio sp.]MBK8894167.1 type II toxin-antitoxin system death-on-curing family toxin [Propionivibrio sp.]
MIAWRWIEDNVVLAVHEAQLAEHGGLVGVRDTGLLSSALSRPRNLAAYGSPDAADLAAAYAFGLARNHPFVDGNKRTAFVCAELFLLLHGYRLAASDAECVTQMLRLASGSLDEPDCAAWLRASSVEMQ